MVNRILTHAVKETLCGEPCENVCTDWDAVWNAATGVSREHVLHLHGKV